MKLLYNKKYRELVKKQSKEQVLFLIQNSIEFSIVVNMEGEVSFNPPLPDYILSSFQSFTMFTISGYTFKSAYVENDELVFEAGFGKENFGSIVRVKFDTILQIIIGETPIFINVTATIAQEVKDSFEVFASKERNKKFFKKQTQNKE